MTYVKNNPSNIGNPNYKQGYYYPVNKEKCLNKEIPIKYRSGLELKYMRFFDLNGNVAKWGYEVFFIEYVSYIDKRKHLYYVDFYVEKTNGEKFLIEVKHSKQLRHPRLNIKNGFNKSNIKHFENFKKTYLNNIYKWKFIREYALSNNMKFLILTEKGIR